MAAAFLPPSLRHQWVSCSNFMKKKEAIKILMNGAIGFHNGVGLGISTGITNKDRDQIKEAVKVIWPYLYGHKITKSEWFNLHL